jgi:hypothetical protein
MPADSPLTVTLNRDPWWSAAVLVWAWLAVASSLSWWLVMRQVAGSAWLGAVPLAALAHAAWLVAREWRRGPVVLRWDGLAWSVDDGRRVQAGEACIAIDFDRWMLLRVSSAWVPASADGLPPGRWHALRCALVRHAPQASSPSGTAAEVPA